MGADDKTKNALENAGGKIKEAGGRVTGDDKLVAEGKSDQTKAKLKDAGEDVKDAFRR
jgi:uncharacterized protein YjbJ (UPF0337 family)